MISIEFDKGGKFVKDMNNLVAYSLGFVDGIKLGKRTFYSKFGETIKLVLGEFIDSMARQNPESLHHVYEWYETGSPNARLFDIHYTVSNIGLSMGGNFRQSTSIKNGSTVPFYNKARVMENGMSVKISPVNSEVLAFNDNGEDVFTKNPVSIDSPGGSAVIGSFERAFDLFMNSYFSQAFMQASGIAKNFTDMTIFKKNLQAGVKFGKAPGISAGFKWIANVGVGA